jgi:pectate lyase
MPDKVSSSVFQNVSNGISTSMGANLLVESSVFEGSGKAIYSADGTGSVTAVGVVLGGSSNTAPKGEMTVESVPYPYDVMGSEAVKDRIVGQAGQTVKFMEGSLDEAMAV